jgi:tetratricopeptide (TPR) repeat protein
LKTVLKFYDRFAEQNPTDPKLQVVAAAAFSRVAELHRRLEEFDSATTEYGRAEQIYARLEQEFPQEPHYAAARLDVEMRRVALPGGSSTVDDKRAHSEQASQAAADLAKRFPDELEFQSLRAKAQWTLAMVARQAGQQAETERFMRQAIEQQRKLVDDPTGDRNYLPGLITMQHELAAYLTSIGKLDDAKAFIESSLALLEDGRPDHETRRLLGPQYSQYADVLERLGKTEQASTMRDRAQQLRHEGPGDGPHGPHAGPPHGGPPGPVGPHLGSPQDGPPDFRPPREFDPPGMSPPSEGPDGRRPPPRGGPHDGPRNRGPRGPGSGPAQPDDDFFGPPPGRPPRPPF